MKTRRLRDAGRRVLAPLKRALGTAVLAAGLAVLPSCVAPKPKATPTTKLLPSRHRGDSELRKALEKVRSLKGKKGEESAIRKMEEKLTKTIKDGQKWYLARLGAIPPGMTKLFPVKTTIRIVHAGDSLAFTSLDTKPAKVSKVGAKALHLSNGFSFDYGGIYTMGEYILCVSFMVQKLPDGSAKVYLTTPGKYAPKK